MEGVSSIASKKSKLAQLEEQVKQLKEEIRDEDTYDLPLLFRLVVMHGFDSLRDIRHICSVSSHNAIRWYRECLTYECCFIFHTMCHAVNSFTIMNILRMPSMLLLSLHEKMKLETVIKPPHDVLKAYMRETLFAVFCKNDVILYTHRFIQSNVQTCYASVSVLCDVDMLEKDVTCKYFIFTVLKNNKSCVP